MFSLDLKWIVDSLSFIRWAGGAFLDQLNSRDDDEDDQDALKEAFLETSPYLLGLTIAVSILHSVFEMLAFKNGKIKVWFGFVYTLFLSKIARSSFLENVFRTFIHSKWA